MPAADARQFYDELSPFYDLIYEDWDASMARQGAAIEAMIASELGSSPRARVLDAACGIGTQALPLAQRGFQVTGRDLSQGAIARLQQEAEARHLDIDAGVADMREVAATVTGQYDVALAFDNSLPHLVTDGDIVAAFRQFRDVLRPGGLCVCSVRDYDTVQRGVDTVQQYGERQRGPDTFKLWQEWRWEDPFRYRVTMVIEREGPTPTRVLQTDACYYAISTERLLQLMTEAGLVNCRRQDGVIYQPVLVGRAS